MLIAGAAQAQQTQSTINPNVPPVGFLVEQSGPQFRDNFQRAINDLNVLFGRIGSNNARTRLTAPLTLFASFASGTNVAGCGLASGASACRTLQFLYNQVFVPNYDTGGQTVTLSFDSTDTTGLSINTQWTDRGTLNVQGPGGTCTAQTIGIATVGNAVAVFAPLPAPLNLIGLKISSSAGDAVANFAPGTINVNNVNFGTTSGVHMHAATTGAQVDWTGAYCISGGAFAHYQATLGGSISGASAVTLTGTPAFTTAFAEAYGLGVVFAPGVTFTGSATGSKFLAALNGVVATNSGDPNYFPGNSAGLTSQGGQYQ